METTLLPYQHLKIQLEEIISATNNFDPNNRIGIGGFGTVYIGEVSHSKGRSKVAIKRLNPDPRHGQGTPEFLKEVMTLSLYRHENLVALLGFCCQGSEMILVYQYASHESLDRHLNSSAITWVRRLKICLGAAKGLSYLHDPRGTHQRLIHRDMKSANILLDDKWNAIVADFGLSIMAPANEQHSVIVTNAAGTSGYCDPQYARTQTLTKESDVYSFGVVLFEVLCGRLCCTYRGGRLENNLVPTWIQSYKEGKLSDIIFKHPTIQPLDQSALESFSEIAYRCLNESRKDRPKMADVVTQLEIALDNQEISEGKLYFDYEDMAKSAMPPLNYRSKGELLNLLTKGVLLNSGKTWLSINKKGEHCEIISFAECVPDRTPESFFGEYIAPEYKSRFVLGPYKYYKKNSRIKVHVKTRFLTPGITYMVSILYKNHFRDAVGIHDYICIEYKLPGETKPLISYIADIRGDGWWMCELYQITSDQKVVDFEILFDLSSTCVDYIAVEGIEFRPLEKVEQKDEKQPILDSDATWEEQLPTDYEEILKWSTNSVEWTTKKEAYSTIRNGFLIDDGQKWFSLDKNGKKCHMQSAELFPYLMKKADHNHSLPRSRFGEAFEYYTIYLGMHIDTKIHSKLLSPETTYAGYLVYQLPEDQSQYKEPVKLRSNLTLEEEYIYLLTPQTSVITIKGGDQNTHILVNKPYKKGLPRQRNDGWMEVQILEFTTLTTTEMIHIRIYESMGSVSSEIFVEGFELRAI